MLKKLNVEDLNISSGDYSIFRFIFGLLCIGFLSYYEYNNLNEFEKRNKKDKKDKRNRKYYRSLNLPMIPEVNEDADS